MSQRMACLHWQAAKRMDGPFAKEYILRCTGHEALL